MGRDGMRMVDWVRILALLAGLAACSRPPVAESFPGPPVSRPDHIFVAYFAVTPEQIRLDRGLTARIVRAAGDQSWDVETSQTIHVLRAGLAEAIVRRLKTYGLSAEIATNNTGGVSGLLVQGQIVRINATRHVLIGLAGTEGGIDADTQIYHITETSPPRLLTAFPGQSDDDATPDADRLADAIGPRIGAFAVAQGWIPQSALK